MPIRSRLKTFTYLYPDGSAWIFRKEKLDDDDEQIQKMVSETIYEKINPRELRQARRENRVEDLVLSKVKTETRMSTKRASLLHMTVSWAGPEFVIPEDYVKGEEFNAPETDRKGGHVPHPLAGQVAPVAAEWIGVRDADDIEEVYEILDGVWSGREEADQESFRRGTQDLDGPGSESVA